ncbi:MAG: hypothetical protein ABIH23_21845 [bacterium]
MKWIEWLDKIRFMNVKVWDFSVRSMLRQYGWKFMTHVILRHPVKTLIGISEYRKEGSQDKRGDCLTTVPRNLEQWRGGGNSIVGVGFCLKPIDPVCVSGRANHNCFFFERNLHIADKTIPECCKGCSIRSIGLLALQAGCRFYIMTSARDILYDVLLPGINDNTYANGLFVICRYSFEPFKVALLISGIKGYLFPYQIGDCRDYTSWLSADIGVKDEQTEVAGENCSAIKEILRQSEDSDSMEWKCEKVGNIFDVQSEKEERLGGSLALPALAKLGG